MRQRIRHEPAEMPRESVRTFENAAELFSVILESLAGKLPALRMRMLSLCVIRVVIPLSQRYHAIARKISINQRSASSILLNAGVLVYGRTRVPQQLTRIPD